MYKFHSHRDQICYDTFKVDDIMDYNEDIVNYASTVVIDKDSCKSKLAGHTDIIHHVNLYLICTLGPGALDETGKSNTQNWNSNQSCEKNTKDNLYNFRRVRNDQGKTSFAL